MTEAAMACHEVMKSGVHDVAGCAWTFLLHCLALLRWQAFLSDVMHFVVTNEGADLELLSMKAEQVSTLQACLEASETEAAAAQARISELQTTLAEMQVTHQIDILHQL